MKKYQVARHNLNVGFRRHQPSDKLLTFQELGADSDEALALYVQRGDLVEHEVEQESLASVYELDLKVQVAPPPSEEAPAEPESDNPEAPVAPPEAPRNLPPPVGNRAALQEPAKPPRKGKGEKEGSKE